MPSKRSFIDNSPKLFIALKQIDMDTFYRHLSIIAERRYPVTLYEQLVIELTNQSFSLQDAYRSGGTPYELSNREPEPPVSPRQAAAISTTKTTQPIASISANSPSATVSGALSRGRPTAGPPPRHAGATSPPSSTPRSTPRCASPTRTSTPFLPKRTSSFSPRTRTRSS